MNSIAPVSVPIGVIVERRKADSPWLDYTWKAIEVLPGEAAAAPWTPVGLKEATDKFYAGTTFVRLYPTETPNYRYNLASGDPMLWVVLRATDGDPPYTLLTVTADPSEGEAATEAGNDLVEAVRMPPSICRLLEAFVAEYDVDRPFIKRHRDRVELEVRGRRRIGDKKK